MAILLSLLAEARAKIKLQSAIDMQAPIMVKISTMA